VQVLLNRIKIRAGLLTLGALILGFRGGIEITIKAGSSNAHGIQGDLVFLNLLAAACSLFAVDGINALLNKGQMRRRASAYQSTLDRVITNQIELGAKLTSVTPGGVRLE
jgi:hypothetical protein